MAVTQERWGSQFEYLLSCLGYAVGIGNIWRFPYLCYRNGGGAFLIPYFLTLFICGIPLVYLETTLGQFASAGCISVFNINPLFKGAGYAVIVLNVIAVTYFSSIMAYPVLYIYHSMSSPLPWQGCGNSWNTDKCTEITGNSSVFTSNRSVSTPEDEFFHIRLLRMSPSINEVGGIVWPVFWANVICWIIVYLCICNGVKSVGKIVYFTVLFPYVVLGILFLRGVTLPGAWKGISFYIWPDWGQLAKPKVWADAATQLFFSLGPGWGGLVSMASFNKFHFDNIRPSVIIPLVNSGTSIWAGFVVFSVLGFAAERTNVPVGEVATAGPGLAFITYPAAVAMMPTPNFWAVTFFFMLFLLGVDTMFVTIEAVITGFIDEFPALRTKKRLVSLGTCIALFAVSIICNTETSIKTFMRPSVIIPLVNSGTSIWAGFVVFSVLGFAAERTNVPVGEVATAGPGLAFITYPAAVAMMPTPNFWAVTFFFMLFLLGVDTMFVTIEAVITGFIDEFPALRTKKRLVSLGTCIALFAVSIICNTEGGLHIINLLDAHVAIAVVPTVCLLEIVATVYTYGAERISGDVMFMTGKPLGKLWLFLWRYIIPAILITIVAYSLEEASAWGWLVALSSSVIIPLYAAKVLFSAKGSLKERLKTSCQPNEDWGPSEAHIREQWIRQHQ